MANVILERLRQCVLDHRYTFTEHAYDEMDDDDLDALDVEAAVLTGEIEKAYGDDPRGPRYVVLGKACDLATDVGVVVRFTTPDRLLIITVYEVE